MPDPIPSCFRAAATGSPPASTAAGPSLTTSIYSTHLGLADLTWSRTALGLSLLVDLHLSSAEDDDPLHFRLRPWIFWKRRGAKRFHLKEDRHSHRAVDFAWDLTRAKFDSDGGPEPIAGFFVSVSVDGEMLLVAGDRADEACRKTKGEKPKSVLISRREHVVLGRSYTTTARFGGREREISIDLVGRETERERNGGMCLGVDGKKVLEVKRLRWKFRGSEKVEMEGGDRIQVSWDLHNWFFQTKNEEGSASAVFVFRFEREGEGCFGKDGGEKMVGDGAYKGYFGKDGNWSESSSGGGEVGKKRKEEEEKKKKKKKRLVKTSSSSSSSSASSGSSSTVMEWASTEETELLNSDGFSLLVYARKS